MMNFVVMIGVGIGAYVLGVFGFAQIIGSLQMHQEEAQLLRYLR